MTKGYYTILPGRSAVTVSGPDAADFLQGLVTNDVAHVSADQVLYSALLTPQGKYAFDFFMTATPDGIALETDSASADDLAKRLAMFKLRKVITIDVKPVDVFAAWGGDAPGHARDQRHANLGYRTHTAPDGFEAVDFDVYDRMRLSLGVPDGFRDFARGEDTVADMNLEALNGVSFTKGCYMGQELTSRMHHRGLAKRGLYPVKISGEVLLPFTDIMIDGNLIGEMRSSNGNQGLAMLRHDSLAQAAKAGITRI